jgi:hypothetical protein
MEAQITAKQAEIVYRRLVETERYLTKVRNRMLELGSHVDDRLFRKVYVAQMTLRELTEELHRLSSAQFYPQPR